jgi:hypothetical protein
MKERINIMVAYPDNGSTPLVVRVGDKLVGKRFYKVELEGLQDVEALLTAEGVSWAYKVLRLAMRRKAPAYDDDNLITNFGLSKIRGKLE